MGKTKIAICSNDAEYRKRLITCWMHHYSERYDVFAYTSVQEIPKEQVDDYHVIVTDDTEIECWENINRIKERLVFLYEKDEDVPSLEGIVYEQKYQEVYKLQKKIEQMYKMTNRKLKKTSGQVVGVYALGNENKQLPFCAVCAQEYATKGKTIVINFQQNSSFETDEERKHIVFCMEDIMTMAKTGVFTKSRFLRALGQEENWDYVYSVKNTECLAEMTYEMYEKMLELLVQEFQYESIIINFGAPFSGMFDVMESCDDFYLLVANQEALNEREQFFLRELEARNMEAFGQKIVRLELPEAVTGALGWRRLSAQWRWSRVGDFVRWNMEEGKKDGPLV